jgi:hypothetical protein
MLGMSSDNNPHNSQVKYEKPDNLFQKAAAPELCGFSGKRRIRLLIITAYYIFSHFSRFDKVIFYSGNSHQKG